MNNGVTGVNERGELKQRMITVETSSTDKIIHILLYKWLFNLSLKQQTKTEYFRIKMKDKKKGEEY